MKEIKINNTCNRKLISLQDCDLRDTDIESIQPCIPYLEDLNISRNKKMSSQVIRHISDSIIKAIEINNTCNLKFINLSNCHLIDQHIESLQPCIPYLEDLDISLNKKMSSQVMKHIRVHN